MSLHVLLHGYVSLHVLLHGYVSLHVLLHGYVLLQIFYQELDYRIQIHKVPYHLHLEETHIPH